MLLNALSVLAVITGAKLRHLCFAKQFFILSCKIIHRCGELIKARLVGATKDSDLLWFYPPDPRGFA